MSQQPTDGFAAFLEAAGQTTKENPFEPPPQNVKNEIPCVEAEGKEPSPVAEPQAQATFPAQPTAQPNGQYHMFDDRKPEPLKPAEQPAPNMAAYTFPAAAGNEPVQEVKEAAEATEPAAAQADTSAGPNTQNAAVTAIDPFVALQQEQQQKQREQLLEPLRKKNPVFVHGEMVHEITNPDESFRALKVRFMNEFPEFGEGSVTWKIDYGKEIKIISKDTDKIHDVKRQIEESDSFQKRLLKAKTDEERAPVCYIKPQVTGKKKGELLLPDFKAHCATLEEAVECPKPLVILPSSDGRFYRLEKKQLGTFVAPAQKLPEFVEVDTAFHLSLKKIPLELLYQCIAFFRSVWLNKGTEALAMIRFNTLSEEFRIDIPEQNTSSEVVEAVDGTYELDSNSIHVMDIHSHHTMAAIFSATDNRDELATGLYAVVGRIDDPVPDISLRASCGGYFFPVALSAVFDTECRYPSSWDDRVHKQKEPSKLYHIGSYKSKILEAEAAS